MGTVGCMKAAERSDSLISERTGSIFSANEKDDGGQMDDLMMKINEQQYEFQDFKSACSI